jgi:hypothetical protein
MLQSSGTNRLYSAREGFAESTCHQLSIVSPPPMHSSMLTEPRSFPQFGRSVWNVMRHRSDVWPSDSPDARQLEVHVTSALASQGCACHGESCPTGCGGACGCQSKGGSGPEGDSLLFSDRATWECDRFSAGEHDLRPHPDGGVSVAPPQPVGGARGYRSEAQVGQVVASEPSAPLHYGSSVGHLKTCGGELGASVVGRPTCAEKDRMARRGHGAVCEEPFPKGPSCPIDCITLDDGTILECKCVGEWAVLPRRKDFDPHTVEIVSVSPQDECVRQGKCRRRNYPGSGCKCLCYNPATTPDPGNHHATCFPCGLFGGKTNWRDPRYVSPP